MKRAVMIICLMMTPVLAQGATYYVAKTGDDSIGCGQLTSMSRAKRTIVSGLRCLKPGDSLVIGPGIYEEAINSRDIPSGVSRAQATTIRAEVAGTVTLQPRAGGAAGDVIWMSGQRYVVLEGLVVDAQQVKVQGIRINSKGTRDAAHIRMFKLEVRNAPESNCIGVTGTFIEIRDSKIHHCGSGRLHHGVYLRGSNLLVEGSEIYGNYGFGVHQYDRSGASHNAVIRYNQIYDNGSIGILIGSGRNNAAYGNVVRNNGAHSGEGGIRIGYFGASNNRTYDNIVMANAGWCIRILRGSLESKVYDNTCWQNGRDTIMNLGSGSVVTGNKITSPRLEEEKPWQAVTAPGNLSTQDKTDASGYRLTGPGSHGR